MKSNLLKIWSVPAILLLLLAYAAFIEPYHLIWPVYQQSSVHGDKIRVVQISDLHLNKLGQRELEIQSKLLQIKPDVLVLTGDVIDHAQSLSELERFLAGLTAPHKVAILGNWEYWSKTDLTALNLLYQRYNVVLLVNQRHSFVIRQRTLDVIGLDDYTASTPDLPFDKSAIHATTLLLQHSPGWFEQFKHSRHKFDLCLAGHTHGGQVTLFGLPIWRPPGSGDFNAGFYQTALCPLYVSQGVGTSTVPLRFGARPEVVIFEL